MIIRYPENLPVCRYRSQFLELIEQSSVVIVEGETGSGKTTQLPKFCLEYLADKPGKIGCTQPRRIAASTVCFRVQEELEDNGVLVGYKIRFHDKSKKTNRIKFMTDGVLLAETKNDPFLSEYDIIIVDEAHERSLNIDFLLGYLKNLLTKRRDLKVIITSATIDTQSFAAHFDKAPVISVEGKTYPVTVRYNPYDEQEENNSYLDHCIQSVIDFYRSVPPGDMLVFLPTEKDIRQCCDVLQSQLKDTLILPLFGRLQQKDQQSVFKHYGKAKIVVATNVAETSVTVPGIRYVVDSGLARISQYNVRAKTTSLPVTRISQASCDQRKGRCGRIGPGICLRLFSEEDYESRDQYTLPEIKRANLANVILQMSSLGLGSPLDFPFVEPPLPRAVRDGEKLLAELGAISSKAILTKYGQIMAQLPIDPCISRIVIEANQQNCLKEIQIIASALAIQDPRVRPADKEQQADDAHRIFHHPQSDFLTLLNIWNSLQTNLGSAFSWSALKKFCKAHYLSFQRMREWIDLHEQMSRLLEQRENFRINNEDASYESIHIALTSGYLRNIARKKEKQLYQAPQNLELMIFPGSHLFKTAGEWIVAATFLETSRLFALTVANIDPAWLELTGRHLCKYTHSEARWNKKNGQVVANERVSLFGLIIVQSRKVSYGKIGSQREEARHIFIRDALLTGEIFGKYSFLDHNLDLVQQYQEAEHKVRAKGIVVDDMQLIEFYDRKLPSEVYNRPTLNKWLSRNKDGHQKLLMKPEDILSRELKGSELVDFPDTISIGPIELKLSYKFTPGKEDDGMTVTVPISLAHDLQTDIFEWLVPGLLPEKVHLLLKGLPKSIRKKLVPLNNTVDLLLDDMEIGKGNLFSQLEKLIVKHFRFLIARSEWSLDLPAHLIPRYALVSDQGKVVKAGRDLANLLQNLEKAKSQKSALKADRSDQKSYQAHNNRLVKTWDFEDLPSEIILYNKANQASSIIYPYLDPEPNSGGARIQFTDKKQEAGRRNIIGMTCLYRLQFADQYKPFKKYCTTSLTGPSTILFFKGYKQKADLVDAMINFILIELFDCADGSIPSRTGFDATIERVKKNNFYQSCQQHLDQIIQLVRLHQQCFGNLQKFASRNRQTNSFNEGIYQGLLETLERFLPVDFLSSCSLDRVLYADRLLQSLIVRIDRTNANPLKEKQKFDQYKPYLHQLDMLTKQHETFSEEAKKRLSEFETLVLEYHIALFTPELKTRVKVSPKVLKNHHQELTRICG